MGLCASLEKNKKQSNYHDREPHDTSGLKNKKLPKLQFNAVLANIKLKKYPYKIAIPIFSIGQNKGFTLPERRKDNQQTLKWMICHRYDFMMTEYELRKNFLKVEIFNEDNTMVGDIIINLYVIATGPFHQDFSINYINQKIGRVIFDLKLSQIIELKIQSELAEVFLIKKHPGQQFSFTIKTIVGYNGSTSESDPSYPAIVLLQNKSSEMIQSSDQINQLEGLMKNKRRTSQKTYTKEICMGQNLMWNKKGGSLPYLTTKVIASELHNIYFQILIWKHSSINQDTEKEFFADCYFSFCKLFGTQATIIKDGIHQYQSRKIQMTEKIQHYGKDYGKAKLQFRIINQPYFKQYQVCVNTEVGVLKTSPIFGVQETKTSDDKCPQLKQILTRRQSVQQNVISLNKLEHEGSNEQIKNKKSDIAQQLQNIFNILQKPSAFSNEQFFFSYSSQKQLLKGQKILVELGMKITEYIQIEDPEINDRCWLILISLIKRGQFNLNHIGFNQKQKKQILSNQLDTYLQKKQKVAVIYKLFLYKLLDLILSSLNRKCSQYQRTFAQIFSAYAYFRIPEFRKQILRLITHQNDPQIAEWKGIQFNLHQDLSQTKIKSNTNIFGQIFDWDQHFYKCILKDQQIQNQNVTIQDILCHVSWKERFAKRGLAFFYFLKYWVIYIQNNLHQKKDIPWRQFPGYNRLLKGFFVQMKIRKILDYPDALIEAGLKLLTNQKIINPFMKILLNKTNIYDTSAVIRVLEYLIIIFKSFKSNKRQLPISFNYSYLFKGLKIIFQSQLSLGISSAITLIYTHFNLFHIQFRKSISMYFLGSIFWKLFLNWSFTVRNIFYHLITYKIYGDAHYLSDSLENKKFSISNNDILARFDELMNILTNQSKKYEMMKINMSTDYHHKEMYRKMMLKANERLKSKKEKTMKFNIQSEEISDKMMNSENSRQFQYTLKTQIKSKQHANMLFSKKIVRSYSSQVIINTKINPHKKQNKKISSFLNTQGKFLELYQQIDNNSILIQRIIHQKEFLIPEISQEQVKYIPLCFNKFKEIQRKFIECLQKQDRSCPQIRYQISIDNRQIRPDRIDDW